MLISCKCLNFIANSNINPGDINSAGDGTTSSSSSGGNALAAALMQAFLQKWPRSFVFYSQFMDFFKQSFGPIPDLSINAINQRDLIHSLTLDVPVPQEAPTTLQSWQISICINCNAVLCAKRLQSNTGGGGTANLSGLSINPPQYLVNIALLTNNDELSHRRADKSFSDTFGLLIMDHPHLMAAQNGSMTPSASSSTSSLSSNNFSMAGGMAANASTAADSKQQRLRQLQQHLQHCLKREIAETDERIQRYTEQQFNLLKSYREKSEREFDLLTRLVQRVPEQQASEFLDRAPPALDVSGSGVSYLTRRRNTIGSRRDLTAMSSQPSTATTPTTNLLTANNIFPTITAATGTGIASAINTAANTQQQQQQQQQQTQQQTILARKMSNFDTPPATPEATPMSVGNSPTFRQQQQQQQQQQQPPQTLPQPFIRLVTQQSFQQQFPTPTVETADDCLFELEGVESTDGGTVTFSNMYRQQQQTQQQQHQSLNPLQQHAQQPHLQRINSSNHSDLDEGDLAEEAEDALDMDSSMPIPMLDKQRSSAATDNLNFAKSLPIAIANSPMVERTYMADLDEEELYNNLDIAASIKALAKSVHGEAVFGDLPRPRLRSQI